MKTLTIAVTGNAQSVDNTATTQEVGITLLKHAIDLSRDPASCGRPITISAFGVTCTAKLVDDAASPSPEGEP